MIILFQAAPEENENDFHCPTALDEAIPCSRVIFFCGQNRWGSLKVPAKSYIVTPRLAAGLSCQSPVRATRLLERCTSFRYGALLRCGRCWI